MGKVREAPFEFDSVHRADCVKAMAKLPEGCVDLAFADPPFNIGYHYDVYQDRRKDEEYQDWSREWIRGVYRALKPDGTFWLAIGDEYAAELKMIATREVGFVCRSWVIWYYTFGVNCKNKFSRSHAHLFYFVKDPQRFTFRQDRILQPSARQLVYADKRANPKGRLPDDTWIIRPQDAPNRLRPEETSWYVPRVCGTFKERAGWHGCQMPEHVLGRIIQTCSDPRELVLDPFAGSGTTLAVAKKLHRRYLGFDLSRDYVKQTKKRLAGVDPGQGLSGVDAQRGAPPTPTGRTGAAALHRRKRLNPSATPFDVAATEVGRMAVEAKARDVAIVQAFLLACDGFSVDRVVLDPAMNAKFVEVCRDIGLEDSPTDLNMRLFGLRKAGRLAGLPRARSTKLPWARLDPFLFASEVAWLLVGNERDKSLDEILCSPDLAADFDEIAGQLAPGWTPFEYRWAAMQLRKRSAAQRKLAESVQWDPAQYPLTPAEDPSAWPECGGIYRISQGSQGLYIGETWSLRPRLKAHKERLRDLIQRVAPQRSSDPPRIEALELPQVPTRQRWGLYVAFARQAHPLISCVTAAGNAA